MKKVFLMMFCMLAFLPCMLCTNAEEASPSPQPSEAAPAVVTASDSVIVIDGDSGNVLFENNSDVQGNPLSLTKIMGVYLASESLDAAQDVTMSDAAFTTYDHNSGVLWIQQGETMSAESAMYASMLASANDAAAMLAEAVSTDQDTFIARMNEQASALGMSNTHFDNIFGISSENNYSTPHDFALLARAALKNSEFAKIWSSVNYTIPADNMSASRTIVSDCQLINESSGSYYNLAVGGKIAGTADSGYALCASAKRGDTNLIAVVFNEADEASAYSDVKALFEYGFSSYQTVTLKADQIGTKTVEVYSNGKHVSDVEFSADGDFSVLLPASVDASTLTAEIEVANEDSSDPDLISAQVVFTLDGRTVGTADVKKTVSAVSSDADQKDSADHISIQQVIDYISVGMLAFIVLLPVIIRIIGGLMPPGDE